MRPKYLINSTLGTANYHDKHKTGPYIRKNGKHSWKNALLVALLCGGCAVSTVGDGIHKKLDQIVEHISDVQAGGLFDKKVDYESIDIQTKVQHNLDFIQHYPHSAIISRVKKTCSRLSQYQDFLEHAQQIYGVGLAKQYAILATETQGNTRERSPKGAAGFPQLMKETAIELDVRITKSEDWRFHPSAIINGVKYLRQLEDMYGNPIIARMAYNYGPGNIDKKLAKSGFIENGGCVGLQSITLRNMPKDFWNSLPQETQNYIIRIYTRQELLENPEKYGFDFDRKPLWSQSIEEADSYKIKKGDNLDRIAHKEKISMTELKRLNPQIRNWNYVVPGQAIYVPRG